VAAQVYLLVALIVLAMGCALVVLAGRRGRPGHLTRLAGVAFALVVAGVIFGAHRVLGYALIGTGVALAVVDIVRRARRRAA
jgi:hypothetical protein